MTKKAFIIGNYDYKSFSKLNGVKKDIVDIQTILELKSFEVSKYENLNFDNFLKLTQNIQLIQEDDEIIFYYAGHSLQFFDSYYFVPIDCDQNSCKEIEYLEKSCIYLGDIIAWMATTQKAKILILDACRDSYIENEMIYKNDIFNKGLIEIEKFTNFIIAFSTNSGNTAKETKYNGLYTKHLKNHLIKYDLSIEDILILTRKAVLQESKLGQVPWEYSSLVDKYYLSQLTLNNVVYKIPLKFNGIETIKKYDSNLLVSTQKSITYINFTKEDVISIYNNENKIIDFMPLEQPVVRNFTLLNEDYVEKIKANNDYFYLITTNGYLYKVSIDNLNQCDANHGTPLPTINYNPIEIFKHENTLFGLDVNNQFIVISDDEKNIFVFENETFLYKIICESDIYDLCIYENQIFIATCNGFYQHSIPSQETLLIEDTKHFIIDCVWKEKKQIYFAYHEGVASLDIQTSKVDTLITFEVDIRASSLCVYQSRFVIYWQYNNALIMYDTKLNIIVDRYEVDNIEVSTIHGIDIIENLLITRFDKYQIGVFKLK